MRSRGLQLRSTQQSSLVAAVVGVLLLVAAAPASEAKLRQNYYASTCPNVETLVRGAVTQKLQETFNAAPGTLRLFFHDCFVRGCDASVLISGPGDEHSAGADTTLSPDALDLITRAKTAVEASCSNRVSCADILALATRDVVSQDGSRPAVCMNQMGLREKTAEASSSSPTFGAQVLYGVAAASHSLFVQRFSFCVLA